jgi:F-type H+-transporting ATPase subunit b
MIFSRRYLLLVLLSLFVAAFLGSSCFAAEEAATGHGHAAVAAEHAGAAPAAGHEAEAGHEGHEGHSHALTHVQIMNFIWHCLNFTLLVLILLKYLKKPIADSLKGRSESIAKAFDDLEAKKVEAEKKYAEYEKKLSGMDEEAKKILESFVKQGEAEKDKIIKQAQETEERIRAQAEYYVQQELAKAKKELQDEVANVAVKMAEEIIRKNLTEQDHSKLISEYLERVVHKN